MVVSGHNRSEPPRAKIQELDYRCIAALWTPITVDAKSWFQVSLHERLCPTLSALLGRRPARRSGNVGNLVVAQVKEMAGGKLNAVLLINDDRRHAVRGPRVECHERRPAAEFADTIDAWP